MNTQEHDWICCGHTDDFEVVLARYRAWMLDQERLGFQPGSVTIVATRDPRGKWAVEVERRLFDASLGEVW